MKKALFLAIIAAATTIGSGCTAEGRVNGDFLANGKIFRFGASLGRQPGYELQPTTTPTAQE